MAEKERKPTPTEETAEVAKQVTALWMEFRGIFRKAFSSQEITPEEERHFLDIKSHLSRLQRILTQRLPEGFRWGSKRITGLMQECISIAALRDKPPADRKALYEQWHGAYISLENLLGVLDVLLDGFSVTFEATVKKSGNIKAQMNAARKNKGKSSKVGIITAVITLLLLAARYYFKYRR